MFYTQILLLIIILNVLVYSFMRTEGFEEADLENKQEIVTLQQCGRDIFFKQFGDKYLASQRAKLDDSVRFNPSGSCHLENSSEVSFNEDMSVAVERNMYYKLNKACVRMKMSSYSFPNDNHVHVNTPIDEETNRLNLLKMMMANPLFVEFNFPDKRSRAYIFNYFGAHRESYYGGNALLDFQKIGGNCDPLFDYETKAPHQTWVEDSDLSGEDHIDLWIYYLDDSDAGLQETGRSLPININDESQKKDNNSLYVFEKDYVNKYGSDRTSPRYLFMNNIAFMYNNHVIPTFSITFTFLIGPSYYDKGTHAMVNCVINNGHRRWKDDLHEMPDWCESNMFHIHLWNHHNKAKIICKTADRSADGATACGNRSKNTNAPNLVLEMEKPSQDTRVTATFAISHSEKVGLLEWEDPAKQSNKKLYAVGLRRHCIFGPNINSCNTPKSKGGAWTRHAEDGKTSWAWLSSAQANIFGNYHHVPRPRLEDIYLHYTPGLVKDIVDFRLGMTNLLKKITI